MSISWAPQPTPAELLDPFARRSIRSFLRREDERNDAALAAFWELIYSAASSVPHETARAVDAELVSTRKRVSDVLAGWRPAALKAGETK